jgi:hypothetical protein
MLFKRVDSGPDFVQQLRWQLRVTLLRGNLLAAGKNPVQQADKSHTAPGIR